MNPYTVCIYTPLYTVLKIKFNSDYLSTMSHCVEVVNAYARRGYTDFFVSRP